jgi:hypothetical protein
MVNGKLFRNVFFYSFEINENLDLLACYDYKKTYV